MNLSNDAEVLSIIITLNEQFPIAWTFVPGINQLIAIQLDRVKLNERVRLIINDDQSVLVRISIILLFIFRNSLLLSFIINFFLL